MKYILLVGVLISSISFADWADTYDCSMTSYFEVSEDGKQTNYVLETFKFTLNREKDAMVFDSSGHFAGSEMKIQKRNRFIDMGIWKSEDHISHLFFNANKISYVELALRAVVVTADCEKLRQV